MSQRTHKRWVIINIIRIIWLHFDLMLWITSYRNRMRRRCLVQKWFRAYYCGIAAALFLTDLMNWQSTQSSAVWTSIRDNSHVCVRLRYHGYQMILHLFRPIHGWILGLFTISSLKYANLTYLSTKILGLVHLLPHIKQTAPQSTRKRAETHFFKLPWLSLLCTRVRLTALTHQLKRTALIGQTYFQLLSLLAC